MMKTRFSKNLLILGLVLTNVASGAYMIFSFTQPMKSTVSPIVAKKDKRSDAGATRKAALREALLAKNSEIETCYENFLRTEPVKAQGNILVKWLVNQSGHVSKIHTIESNLHDDTLVSCVVDHLKQLNFGSVVQAFNGGISPSYEDTEPQDLLISHKFVFKPRTPASLAFEAGH